MTTGARRGLLFIAWLLALEGAAFLLNRTGGLDWLMLGTAQVAGALARATGVATVTSGNTIVLDVRTLLVNAECTGVFLAALLVALVAATDAPWRSRVLGALAGVAILGIANVIRLAAVAHIRAWPSFDFVHDIVFQVGFVALVLSIWLVWLNRTVPTSARPRRG